MKLQEFFDKPGKWTKKSNARTVLDTPAPVTHELAVCWCLYGAIFKLWPEESQRQIRLEKQWLILDAAVDLGYWVSTGTWVDVAVINLNDREGITFQDIKAILEHADV